MRDRRSLPTPAALRAAARLLSFFGGSLLVPCAAALAAPAAPAQEEGVAEARPAEAGMAAESDPLLGPPLVIDGKVVPDAVVRREIVLGSAGRVALELAKLKILTDEEVARRVAEGAAPEEFRVSMDEVEQAIAEEKENLREQFPGEEVELEDVLEVGEGGLPNRVQLTKRFFRVFLPEDPADYPGTTLAALNATEEGKTVLESIQKEYERAAEEGTEYEMNPFMQQMLFQTVHDYLHETSMIVEGDPLPVDVALRVNGVDVKVDDLWGEIRGRLSQADVREAKQWITNTRLLERELKERGAWLSEEEAADRYEEYVGPYRGQMFDLEKVALIIKRYPSLERYKTYRRIYESFQDSIAEELTPERLKQYAEEHTRHIVGQTHVNADVILLSAYDFRGKEWKEDGWERARERAREVMRQHAEEGRPFDELLEEYSEFYDPPKPMNEVGEDGFRKNGGRFRAKPRNQLMTLLDESEYYQFLNGATITDFIFFDQEVGTVAPPLRGPFGWYIPHLLSRDSVTQQMEEETLLAMAEQDYVMQHLAELAQRLIAEHEVYGIP